ncbi:uncharacterized protein DS421_9g271040 [Arachis hypogaea]|nr:uncharacterized protein DS421_9g271040 [Arachis hypogaea]
MFGIILVPSRAPKQEFSRKNQLSKSNFLSSLILFYVWRLNIKKQRKKLVSGIFIIVNIIFHEKDLLLTRKDEAFTISNSFRC